MRWKIFANNSKVIMFPSEIKNLKLPDDKISIQEFDSQCRNIQDIKSSLKELDIPFKYRGLNLIETPIPEDKKDDIPSFIKQILHAIKSHESELKNEEEEIKKGSIKLAEKTQEIFKLFSDRPEIANAEIIFNKICEHGDDKIVSDGNIRKDATLQLQTMVYFYYLAETKSNEIKKLLRDSVNPQVTDITKWLSDESAKFSLYSIQPGTIFGEDFKRLTVEGICDHFKYGLLQLNGFFNEVKKHPEHEEELFNNLISDNVHGLNSDKSYLRTMTEMQDWIFTNLPSILATPKKHEEIIPASPISQKSDEESEETPASPTPSFRNKD